MKLVVGSDERTFVTDAVVAELRRRGHEVEWAGAAAEGVEGAAATMAWPHVARHVAEAVAAGAADEGILFCWTGTGVSIAANKVPGIREIRAQKGHSLNSYLVSPISYLSWTPGAPAPSATRCCRSSTP